MAPFTTSPACGCSQYLFSGTEYGYRRRGLATAVSPPYTMTLYKIVLTFFPLFQDGSLNRGDTTALPTLSWGRKSIRVVPVCTEGKSSLPGQKEEDRLPIDLSQHRSKPVPPVDKRDEANLADSCRGVAIVCGLAWKCTDDPGVALLRQKIARLTVNGQIRRVV